MLADEATMKQWSERLLSDLKPISVDVEYDQEHKVYQPAVVMRIRGMTQTIVLPQSFFVGSDYRAIVEVAKRLDGLLEAGAYVQRGEKTQEVDKFGTAMQWLLKEARRGVDIQRYKGLGEMNPDQLWNTTMDPQHRRMLRVTVDDAIATDQMFTTLMGDQVEPRRQFIETNALSVVNLDV
jgi:DNA gyrase subunit B